MHSGYTFFVRMCVPWEPTTFCAANAMLYHWATGTLIKQQNTEKNHSLFLTEKLKYSCFRNQSISIFILTFVHSVSWMLLLNTSIVHGNKALFVLLVYYVYLLVMHRSWFFVADSDTDFFRANWPIPIPIPIFFPLSNQQEIMKDSNTNKVVI